MAVPLFCCRCYHCCLVVNIAETRKGRGKLHDLVQPHPGGGTDISHRGEHEGGGLRGVRDIGVVFGLSGTYLRNLLGVANCGALYLALLVQSVCEAVFVARVTYAACFCGFT